MRTARRFLPLFVCVVLLGLVFLLVSRVDEAQTIASLQVEFSPLPTPTPNPIPVAVSPESVLALDYIAARERIPSEQLEVIGEEARNFPLLNRTYILVTLLYNQPEAPRQFQVWVDTRTKFVEASIADVFQAEQNAHAAKYGKLDPPLYERLQAMRDEETIAVAIWAVEASGEDSTRAAQEEVAQLYPEAAKALQEQGVAWAVEDPDLRLEIKARYAEILTARSGQQVQPIVGWLQERGYAVQELPGAPIVTATLAKKDILTLADLPNVASIQFAGGAAEPSSDISVPSSRIPTVWSRGFTGAGVRLGVIEGGKINGTARGCLNVIATRDNGQPDSLHKSRVAAIAACNNTALPGVASGVQMLDASYPTSASMTEAAFGLQWAVVQNLADVTNHSESWESVTAPQYLDRYYDHLVRAYDFTALVAAGNTTASNGINVATPGKGWNVIGVGNVDDRNSAVWSGTGSGQDDIINSTSSWVNPSTGIEKPELAAPGTNINTVITPEGSGTSYAAPQVAGVAALLMQRASALKNFPSAVKAILMASAVHNVEGTRQLSDKDGAGAIDAALADSIAQVQGGTSACSISCWWNIAIQDNNAGQPETYLPVGGSLYRYFTATRGERIRVVISWMSAATSDGAQDDLRTNLDLKIKRPDNSVIASSVSSVNSYEIVEFVADATGQYAIWVERFATAWPENTNKLGIAWSKQATYLPDVRRESGGWDHSLTIRNDGAEPRDVTVTFFLENGNFAASRSYAAENSGNLLQPNALWSTSLNSSFSIFQGSAIIDGSEDLSVSIATRRSDRAYGDSGVNPGAVGDPAVEHAATTLYAPALYHNAWGYNSTLFVQNTGSVTANGTIYLVGRATSPQGGSCPFSIAPGGRLSITPIACLSSLPSPWVGSARIVSSNGQPLAAQVLGEKPSTADARSFGATATGQTVLHLPAAYKNKWNTNSGVVVQNVGSGNSRVRLTFYERSTGNQTTTFDFGGVYLASGQAIGQWLPDLSLLPDGWVGSIKVESLDGQPLAAIAQVADANDIYEYTAATGSFGSTVLLPRAARYDGSKSTGYIVLNPGNSAVTVTPIYYNAAGAVSYTPTPYTLQPHASAGYHQSGDTSLGSGWTGSILLQATGPIVAVMREDDTAALSASAYNGLVR